MAAIFLSLQQGASINTSTITDSRYSTTNAVSMVVCLLAAVLVVYLKLHKKIVYRLALCQVLSSMALAFAELSQLIFIYYHKNPEFYARLCVAVGWYTMYSLWMKLLFTFWATFHLFYFVILHKNLTRLEALYVATSLLVPAVIACVPLTTGSYGFSHVDGCYIPAYVDNITLRLEVLLLRDLCCGAGPQRQSS